MAAIRAVWGPHKTRRLVDRIVWTFTGVRADGTQAQWLLCFWFDSRRFKTKARGVQPAEVRQVTLGLPEIARSEVTFGRVTDMLRAKLKPEHIVEATRLALEWQRNHGR